MYLSKDDLELIIWQWSHRFDIHGFSINDLLTRVLSAEDEATRNSDKINKTNTQP